MRATARIVAEADGRGGTRLTTMYGEAPLLPRLTGPGEVHLVGGAAGPLGGDELTVEVHVGPGAELTVRTVAASIALPGAGPSRMTVTATVEGQLTWLPEQLVAATGCDHLATSIVDLVGDASLTWREELVAGRHGEAPGRLRQVTHIRRDGVSLLHQELRLDELWGSPAVLGGRRASGMVVLVDPAWTAGRPGPISFSGPDADAARMALATGPAVLCTAIASDTVALRTSLVDLLP